MAYFNLLQIIYYSAFKNLIICLFTLKNINFIIANNLNLYLSQHSTFNSLFIYYSYHL